MKWLDPLAMQRECLLAELCHRLVVRGCTIGIHQFSSVQFLSCVRLCNPTDSSTSDFPVNHQPLELTQTHVHQVSDAIQPSHPLSSPSLPPSIFPSIRVFSNESALHITWPKYWSFSLSISPSNEYSGLISFRMDWLDLLAVQGTLKSLGIHNIDEFTMPQVWSFPLSGS